VRDKERRAKSSPRRITGEGRVGGSVRKESRKRKEPPRSGTEETRSVRRMAPAATYDGNSRSKEIPPGWRRSRAENRMGKSWTRGGRTPGIRPRQAGTGIGRCRLLEDQSRSGTRGFGKSESFRCSGRGAWRNSLAEWLERQYGKLRQPNYVRRGECAGRSNQAVVNCITHKLAD
jgi:hypothetical protein